MNISKKSDNTLDVTKLSCKMLLLSLFAFLLLLTNHTSAFAFINSTPTLNQLVSKSELIVVGEVDTVKYFKENGGNAQVKVEQVLKGKVQNNTIGISIPNMSILIPMSIVGTPNEDVLYSNIVIAKEYGIFFLQKDKDTFISVDPIQTVLPVRKGCQLSDVGSTDVLSLVREELLYTALGPTVYSKEGEATIRFYQEAAKKFNRPKLADMYPTLPMNVKAAEYLAEPVFNDLRNVIPSHEHEAKMFKILLSADNSPTLLRGAVLTTLLTFGQFDVLDEAVKYVDAVQQMTASPQRARLSIQANNIAMAIRYVNGVKYIPVLGRLLQNHNVEVRRSAIHALANFVYQSTPSDKNMKDSVTLPFLIEALDDSDSQVRLRALQALPMAANKRSWSPPLPGQDGIPPQEEQKLIAQWKQWWKDEGSKAFNALPK